MVSRARQIGLLLAGVGVASACQAILGIDDKELDPRYGKDASSGGDAATGPSGNDPRPPPRPAGFPEPSGTGATRWFAARTIYLGTVDPATGQKDSDAWRRIGHDIDGECTTADISKSNTSATCKKPDKASSESLEDGDDCRDNAAGRLLSVGIQQLSSNFEAQFQTDLETAESPTYLLRLDDLDDGPDDPYVRGSLYITVPRDTSTTKPPTWNGEDEFIVDLVSVGATPVPPDGGGDAAPDSGPKDGGSKDATSSDAALGDAKPSDAQVADADASSAETLIDQPRWVFDKGYLKDEIWVSGDFKKSPAKLPLFVLGKIGVVDAATVTLALELTKTHDAAVASQLSVVVNTETLQTTFGPIATEIASCNPLFGNLLMSQFILPARDLGDSPPNFTSPGQPCSGESLGFAFRWEPVKPPQLVTPGPTGTSTCGDAGL